VRGCLGREREREREREAEIGTDGSIEQNKTEQDKS